MFNFSDEQHLVVVFSSCPPPQKSLTVSDGYDAFHVFVKSGFRDPSNNSIGKEKSQSVLPGNEISDHRGLQC